MKVGVAVGKIKNAVESLPIVQRGSGSQERRTFPRPSTQTLVGCFGLPEYQERGVGEQRYKTLQNAPIPQGHDEGVKVTHRRQRKATRRAAGAGENEGN